MVNTWEVLHVDCLPPHMDEGSPLCTDLLRCLSGCRWGPCETYKQIIMHNCTSFSMAINDSTNKKEIPKFPQNLFWPEVGLFNSGSYLRMCERGRYSPCLRLFEDVFHCLSQCESFACAIGSNDKHGREIDRQWSGDSQNCLLLLGV